MKKVWIESEDVFFILGLALVAFFLWSGKGCGELVTLVMAHKGISVADDKIKDSREKNIPTNNNDTTAPRVRISSIQSGQ